jgi:hypothetical protein
MYDNTSCSCGRDVYPQRMAPIGCDRKETGYMDSMPYAMAVVRPQYNPRMFSPAEALCRGTMFPDLYRPYHY